MKENVDFHHASQLLIIIKNVMEAGEAFSLGFSLTWGAISTFMDSATRVRGMANGSYEPEVTVRGILTLSI